MTQAGRFTINRLDPADAAAYRAIRLEGLQSHPEAFGASWEDEAAQPLAWFGERLSGSLVLGGWTEGADLAGVAGLLVPTAAKQRHKGMIWGMFVRPGARGAGLAGDLVARLIGEARGLVEELRLSVIASNAAAIRLYTAAGFVEYGLERRALKVGDVYHDERLMALSLREAAPLGTIATNAGSAPSLSA